MSSAAASAFPSSNSYLNSSFNTKVLQVNKESIFFKPGQDLPEITDKETLENLKEAAKILQDTNEVVGFPTETVYGLGGSSLNDESVKSIYKAKNRPADNPLITHISSINQLKRKILGDNEVIPDIYKPLIEKFWPGPLSILLPVAENCPISKLTTANQPTFAVRMPSHPIARALIAISDTPIAAPSANASTRPSPTTAQHVYHDLHGKIPIILDGGPCTVGVESTVIDGLCDPPMLLRPGGVSLEEIKKYGGLKWQNIVIATKTAGKSEPVRTPGMKYKHYSPTAKVVLFEKCGDGIKEIENYIKNNNLQNSKIAILKSFKFKNFSNKENIIVKNLGSTPAQVSTNLFKLLREVDEQDKVDYIFVEAIPVNDEGLAVMNRLSKAASETIVGNHTEDSFA
ncbi:hypothetical protein PACTADRAFT_40434 [Pachysolen tannophilus NRRL Y-2460]|uniref:Threonylcarbamoyl-AMP synthase n=1 Tax=Pachysolen tannophilus NRRL Y-2460 TaxID=669874 RepID=A0A1E4TXI2_PACTA|nr:hypothetical protein PACTADRAFT_40434 [Pachysolen tannophilus NRRL Y-2460]